MWKDLSYEWHTAFEEAWTAFRKGSIPIGAAIFDEKGELLVKEHNRSAEADTVNKFISHAEANALRRLDTSSCNVRNVVLYTTMEPCPMCMGTSVMSNIKHLRYASRDPYCGSVYMKDSDHYISGKGLDYELESDETEFVQLVIQSYYELSIGKGDHVLRMFAELNGKAVMIAKDLFADKVLEGYADSNTDFSFVYDEIVKRK